MREYLQQILLELKQEYNITRFEEEVLELKPEQCPLRPCIFDRER
jgi:hypothetical protein